LNPRKISDKKSVEFAVSL